MMPMLERLCFFQQVNILILMHKAGSYKQIEARYRAFKYIFERSAS